VFLSFSKITTLLFLLLCYFATLTLCSFVTLLLIVTTSGSTKSFSDDAELTNNMTHKAVEAGSVSAGYNEIIPIIVLDLCQSNSYWKS
jgi:hypothetical protein